MSKELERQLKKIAAQEAKILNHKENRFFQERLNPLRDKLQEKIPDRLVYTLEAAFEKSFELLFEKGDSYIERTYNKDEKQLEHDLLDFALNKAHRRRYLRRMEGGASRARRTNTSFSVLEGSVLGFFGIGLPDIPLFIAVMMRAIYEIALSYGYDYETAEEKAYILLLINAAMSQGEAQRDYSRRVDELARSLDRGGPVEAELDSLMEETAKILAQALLVAKFIQGIPILGTVGGAVNYSIIRRVSRLAELKYKKRYVEKKLLKPELDQA